MSNSIPDKGILASVWQAVKDRSVPLKALTKAEYDVLDETSKNAEVAYLVQLVNGISLMYKNEKINFDSTLENYSTDEVKIGTWFNGQPLYRKCFDVRSPGTANVRATLVKFPKIIPVHIYGCLFVNDSVGSIMPLNFSQGSSNRFIATWYIDNAIQMQQYHESDVFSNKQVFLVAEYVKQ